MSADGISLDLGPSLLDALLPKGARDFDHRFGDGAYQALWACVKHDAEVLRRLSRKELINRLRDDYQCTMEQIAAIVGVTRQRIGQIKPGTLQREIPKPKRRFSKIDKALMRLGVDPDQQREWFHHELIGRGRTQVDLARQLHVAQTAISRRCRKLGIDMAWRTGKVFIPDVIGKTVPGDAEAVYQAESWDLAQVHTERD
jgi:DNA-binding XRE family transcriptional regulator